MNVQNRTLRCLIKLYIFDNQLLMWLVSVGTLFYLQKLILFLIMGRSYLGEFEELVLLTVAVLDQGAYGAAITDEIENQTGRSVSLSAVHAALQRLEEKAMLRSVLGEATKERGGRRKRLFSVTLLGSQTLQNVRDIRSKLWDSITPQALGI